MQWEKVVGIRWLPTLPTLPTPGLHQRYHTQSHRCIKLYSSIPYCITLQKRIAHSKTWLVVPQLCLCLYYMPAWHTCWLHPLPLHLSFLFWKFRQMLERQRIERCGISFDQKVLPRSRWDSGSPLPSERKKAMQKSIWEMTLLWGVAPFFLCTPSISPFVCDLYGTCNA